MYIWKAVNKLIRRCMVVIPKVGMPTFMFSDHIIRYMVVIPKVGMTFLFNDHIVAP